jgi:hypothetical protein
LVQLAEPPGGFGAEQDEQEVVLLAYQVWYLSPSLPIRSLVAGHPEAFRAATASASGCARTYVRSVNEMSAWPSHAATKAKGALELIDAPPPMDNTAFDDGVEVGTESYWTSHFGFRPARPATQSRARLQLAGMSVAWQR